MRRMMSTLHTQERITPSWAPAGVAGQPKSPWHSPVPYLFGGLAAMLGLIAFALLILACSYWKLSRDDTQQHQQQRNNDEGQSRDLEKGDEVCKMNGVPVFEEKIVVIMAGNDKPTFLAKPALMLNNNSKNKCDDDSNDDDHHVMVGSTIANKDDNDDANKEESSSVGDDDDDHAHDDHHHHHDHDDGDDHDDHNDDNDDDEPKEDETTHQPQTSN